MPKLIDWKGKREAEVIPAATKLTLDEAYSVASEFGEPRIGNTWGAHGAELKLHASGHFLVVKCHKRMTPVENLMECVRLGRAVLAALKEAE